MGDLKHQIRFQEGKLIKADALNQTAENIPTLLTGGVGNNVAKFGNRIVVSQQMAQQRYRPTDHRKFVIVSVDTDFLICRTWDGTTLGLEDIYVALPFLLRRTPFDGEEREGFTYAYTSNTTRTSTSVSDLSTEDQIITPDYALGDEILAVRYIKGTTMVYDGGNLLSWEDLNTDGRCWMKVPEE